MGEGGSSPSAHDVTIPTEHLSQTTDHDIRKWQDMYVEEIADGLVDHYGEIVGIGEFSDSLEVGGYEEGVSGKFAEEGKNSLARCELAF